MSESPDPAPVAAADPCPLPAPWPLGVARRVLVFAPHPDDETIGCGGAIALLRQAGVALRVVLVSDGSGAGALPPGTAAARQLEMRAALGRLGVDDLVVVGLPDGSLSGCAGLDQAVLKEVDAFTPEWILGPAEADAHRDHQAVAAAVRRAARARSCVTMVWEYETWSALAVTHVLDIEAVFERKLQALREHKTALACADYLRATEGLARYRGLLLGRPGGGVAECFRGVDRNKIDLDPQPTPDARLQRLHEDYARLEAGYRQLTTSLSWRCTAPLRSVRAGLRAGAMRRGLRALWRALPLAPQTRQRLRVRLLTNPFLSRWVAAAASGDGHLRLGDAQVRPTVDKQAVRARAEEELTAFLATGRTLCFPESASPRVSVIVVLYNQAGLSHWCLQALASSCEVDYELIVFDNASSDRVPELTDRLVGAVVRREGENLGFLRAVNRAAALARGEYLLLLNNDALVEPQTLARAVARLDLDAGAAACGGPILLWDGRLQEAGSIIWRDGACQGYGRGEAPDDPAYAFVRDVDYCSGAFLMLRRTVFEALGGFDERYAPAYYEESDLCVRAIEAGHRVVYDPAVRVKHFEFASAVDAGQALALQARNREVFVQRHAGFLAAQALPGPAAMWRARSRLPARSVRLLVIDDRVPIPALGRGYPRAASLLRELHGAGACVTHFPLLVPNTDVTEVRRVLHERVEVILNRGLPGLEGFLDERRGSFDAVMVSRPHNMEVVQALLRRRPDLLGAAHLIYDAEALCARRDIARAAVLGRPWSAAQQDAAVSDELALASGARMVITVSAAEASVFGAAGHGDVRVLGHGLKVRPTPAPFDRRRGVLFVGAIEEGLDSPNTDSLLWFMQQVWPRIQAALGERALLDLVGPCECAQVRALAGDGVRIRGRVDDVAQWYDRARVFIAPTRFAAGIPHKAHEAAAFGLPMVTSTLVASQLGWEPPALMHADDPVEFAAACVAMHDDEQRWSAARLEALERVLRDCAPEVFAEGVRQLVHDLQPVGAAPEACS